MRLFRYLLRAVLLRFALTLPALALVYLAFYLGDQGRMLAARLGWSAALRISLLHLPLIAVQVMPVALLLGAVLAITALRQRGELEALATFGATPLRTRLPVLVAGVLAAMLALSLDEVAVPACEQAADELQPGSMASALTGLTAPPAWFRRGPWFVHLDRGAVLALEVGRGWRPRQRIDGRLTPRGVGHAVVTELDRDDARRRSVAGVRVPAVERVRSLRATASRRAEAMDARSLARHLRELERAGQGRTAEALVLHTKLAFPAVNLVLALFACLFLGRTAPRPPVWDLAWSAALVVGLWLALSLGWVLARSGWISAASGAWGPVLLAAAVAAMLLGLGRNRPGAGG